MEMLSVVWAAKLFQPYLVGHWCEVLTDHAACSSLLSNRKPSPKLARWVMCIQELDLKINHRPGKSNLMADARPDTYSWWLMCCKWKLLMLGQKTCPRVTLPSYNSKMISLCPFFTTYLEKGSLPADECQAVKCEITDGVLCYQHPRAPDIAHIAVPSCLQPTLFKWEIRRTHCGAEYLF